MVVPGAMLRGWTAVHHEVCSGTGRGFQLPRKGIPSSRVGQPEIRDPVWDPPIGVASRRLDLDPGSRYHSL
jgi:hypothetical protein